MEEGTERDFLSLVNEVEAPAGLNAAIFARIESYSRKRRLYGRAIAASFAPAFFLGAWSISFLLAEVRASSLLPMLSLLQSDTWQLRDFLGEWLMAVADEIPVGAILAFSASAFLLGLLAEGMRRYRHGLARIKEVLR